MAISNYLLYLYLYIYSSKLHIIMNAFPKLKIQKGKTDDIKALPQHQSHYVINTFYRNINNSFSFLQIYN